MFFVCTLHRWLEQYWIEDYWSGLEKARALTEMIDNNEIHPSAFNKYWEKHMLQRPPTPPHMP